MTQVPSGFQPEPGQLRCGDSWPDKITVDGMIPGTGGYGSDRTKTLLAVATMPSGNDWYSYDGAAEREFIEEITFRLGQVDGDIFNADQQGDLSLEEVAAVRYLTTIARNNLARVRNIYLFWNGDLEVHPQTGVRLAKDDPSGRISEWPLQAGASLDQYMPECANKSNEWVSDQELMWTESTEPMRSGETGLNMAHLRYYYCHGLGRKQERAKDRERIRRLTIDAASAVRCAHFGVTRMKLYNEAYKEWSRHQTGLGFGQTPGEFVPQLGFEQRPGEYIPPMGFAIPPDLPGIPDPDTPDLEPEEPVPAGFGEAAPEVPVGAPAPGPIVPVSEPLLSKPLPYIIAGVGTIVATGVVIAVLGR